MWSCIIVFPMYDAHGQSRLGALARTVAIFIPRSDAPLTSEMRYSTPLWLLRPLHTTAPIRKIRIGGSRLLQIKGARSFRVKKGGSLSSIRRCGSLKSTKLSRQDSESENEEGLLSQSRDTVTDIGNQQYHAVLEILTPIDSCYPAVSNDLVPADPVTSLLMWVAEFSLTLGGMWLNRRVCCFHRKSLEHQ